MVCVYHTELRIKFHVYTIGLWQLMNTMNGFMPRVYINLLMSTDSGRHIEALMSVSIRIQRIPLSPILICIVVNFIRRAKETYL